MTFAIPFYSGIAYLERAIASVRGQTLGDWVLVVRDNASPHGGEAARLADAGDPRIRYVRNSTNLGMAGNWNACLDSAETDLVTLLHDDDELLPHYAERMLSAAEREPDAAAFFCRAKLVDGEGRRVFSFPDAYKRLVEPRVRGSAMSVRGEDGLRALMRGNFVMCPTLCYRRSRMGAVRFRTDLRMAADLMLTATLLLEGQRLVGLPDVCYAYRRHTSNATAHATRDLSRFAEESAVFDEVAHLATDRGWRTAARIARRKGILRLHLLFVAAKELARLRVRASVRAALAALRLTSGGTR